MPGLLELPGVPESTRLPPDLAARLPASTPGPPWSCRVQAVLWWHRASPAALEALPAVLRGRRTVGLTLAAFVRYVDSPVGPYSEVFAAPVLVTGPRGVPGVAVPFIAVDSLASVHGGRAHWGLPKALATFTRNGLARVAAVGDGWTVTAQVRPCGPRLPFAGLLPTTNLLADSSVASSLVRQAAVGRLGHVEVGCTGPTLPAWLLPGRHRCMQGLRARMVVGPPRR